MSKSKAAYMRDRRAAAKARRVLGVKLDGITHGLAGYREHGCGCSVCVGAQEAALERLKRYPRGAAK
jgi:hypothetical protein